jgi:hypothetical protein
MKLRLLPLLRLLILLKVLPLLEVLQALKVELRLLRSLWVRTMSIKVIFFHYFVLFSFFFSQGLSYQSLAGVNFVASPQGESRNSEEFQFFSQWRSLISEEFFFLQDEEGYFLNDQGELLTLDQILSLSNPVIIYVPRDNPHGLQYRYSYSAEKQTLVMSILNKDQQRLAARGFTFDPQITAEENFVRIHQSIVSLQKELEIFLKKQEPKALESLKEIESSSVSPPPSEDKKNEENNTRGSIKASHYALYGVTTLLWLIMLYKCLAWKPDYDMVCTAAMAPLALLWIQMIFQTSLKRKDREKEPQP